MIQTMGDRDICSSIGDIEKHEQFKQLSQEQRIAKLQEVYDKYGVKSPQFFIQVKPFLMWTAYRSLRGMHYTYLEDLVNTAYEELIIVFEGGWTTHYNKRKYKEPIYGTPFYYRKFKNIGAFVLYYAGSAVSKYRSKNFRKQVNHEDGGDDIGDRLNFTDFELNNDLGYSLEEPDKEKIFKVFKFNDALKRHLYVIKETSPKNNVLYNFMLWRNRE